MALFLAMFSCFLFETCFCFWTGFLTVSCTSYATKVRTNGTFMLMGKR